jgi:hypothetical protein
MTNVSNDIKAAISTIYKADVEAIRNLADLSKKYKMVDLHFQET